jgi:hypothetical protein
MDDIEITIFPRTMSEADVTPPAQEEAERERAERNCILLKLIVKARELAHIDVRDWKKRYDKGLKVGALLSSTAITYVINAQGSDGAATTLIAERVLSFTTTLFTGLAVMLNNDKKAEIHDKVLTDYANLANMIEGKILSNNCTIDDFNHFSCMFRKIKTPAPNLPPWAAKRHPAARKGMDELKKLDPTYYPRSDTI